MTRRRGFTLIEILAVIAMFALVAAMVAPSLNLGDGRSVQREAEDLGGTLEFARQRAIMTGREHRVVLDLDGARHWVEWDAPADAEPAPAPAADAPRQVALVPPVSARGEPVPVPGPFGRPHRLDDPVRLLEVATLEGGAASGQLALRFGPDGAGDPAVIAIGDAQRAAVYEVEVEALADAVRITHAGR